MEAIDIAIMGMATYRLSHLLAEEWPMLWLRKAIGVVHDNDDHPMGYTNNVARGAMCIWCNSIWLAPWVVVTHIIVPPITIILALSTLTIAINAIIEKLEYRHGKS